ncbi:MAG: GGDEF domain-containing protein [Lachnospiraceae bacterium]|nr:GGDEF domain-containing protein [Lachnospiraceae bacterium]
MEKQITKQEKILNDAFQHGRDCIWSGEYDRAIHIFEECMAQFATMDNYVMYVRALSALGTIFKEIGSRDMAMDCYLRGIKYIRDHNLPSLGGLFYQNVGNCFFELKDFKRAKELFKLGEDALSEDEIVDSDRHRQWLLIAYLNIGVSNIHLNEYEEAKKYMELAEKILPLEKSPEYFIPVLETIKSFIKLKEGDKDYLTNKLDYMFDALKVSQETPSDFSFTVNEMVSLLLEAQRYDDLLRVIQYFESVVERLNLPLMRLETAEMYMLYYKAIGEHAKYEEMCVKHAQYCEQLSVSEREEKIRALNVKVELEEIRNRISDDKDKSGIDGLTRLGNRHAMVKMSNELIDECVATNDYVLVMITDVDCFKEYNDTYGHVGGDSVLRQVADIISGAVKRIGNVFRFGGDEFVVVVKTSDDKQGELLATRIRNALQHLAIKNENSTVKSTLTLSIGGFITKNAGDYSLDELLERADEALYKVKENGKNDYHIIKDSDIKDIKE